MHMMPQPSARVCVCVSACVRARVCSHLLHHVYRHLASAALLSRPRTSHVGLAEGLQGEGEGRARLSDASPLPPTYAELMAKEMAERKAWCACLSERRAMARNDSDAPSSQPGRG